MGFLYKLNAEGMTIVMVTHSYKAARNARRILQISDGLLTDEEIIHHDALNTVSDMSPVVDNAQ
jgi:ABC-type lipoprotein export system ATPase subunit